MVIDIIICNKNWKSKPFLLTFIW